MVAHRDRPDRPVPHIAAAAHAALPGGVVVDGEVVAWNGQRLDFDLLCRRLTTSAAAMAAEAAAHPASFVAFDLLALDAADQRPRPWVQRRAQLAELAAGWRPPLHLSPVTTDLDQARAWFTDYRPAGLEGPGRQTEPLPLTTARFDAHGGCCIEVGGGRAGSVLVFGLFAWHVTRAEDLPGFSRS